MNIQELLQIAGKSGKVVIVGDNGEVKGVLLGEAEYRKLSGSEKPQTEEVDREKINREILEAQLRDNMDFSGGNNLETFSGEVKMPEPIGQLIQDRAKSLFVSHPATSRIEEIDYDPREEVMDPNYGRLAAPRVSTDDEEIKPNFDDI
ncbi:MAG TPA: hypothetical protein PKD79_00765 [Candidatus Doudnabacteria bacterium]|nr:hypothetical protein [Candidatus Doudnabacteria bacterium]